MSNFKENEFDVRSESQGGDARVVKVDGYQGSGVQDFRMPTLNKASQGGKTGVVKAKLDSLSSPVASSGDCAGSRKEARFNFHELVKAPLSIEEEERRVIEDRVRERVAVIEQDARNKASELGYQEGLKRGYEDAIANLRAESGHRMEQLESMLNELDQAKEEIFRANERFLMEMIFRIARMILLRELSTDQEYLLRLSRSLIERVGVRENITIRIHPDQKETIGMLRDGLEKAMGALKNLNVETSTRVRSGGCILETEWNAIDASIDNQLTGIYEALIGPSESGNASPEGGAGQ